MYNIILAVHIVFAVAMIGLILIQHGKGADAGASFGAGASGTVFGAAGSANFLSRATGILAALFFATSLTLAAYARKEAADQLRLDVVDVAPVTSPVAPSSSTNSYTMSSTNTAVSGEVGKLETNHQVPTSNTGVQTAPVVSEKVTNDSQSVASSGITTPQSEVTNANVQPTNSANNANVSTTKMADNNLTAPLHVEGEKEQASDKK